MAVLDSSAIIHLLADTPAGEKICEEFIDQITSTTSICMHEVLVGLKELHRAAALQFFNGLEILPFDQKAAEYSSQLGMKLTKLGKPLGQGDLFIASICLLHDLPLITTDRGFMRVEGLKVYLI